MRSIDNIADSNNNNTTKIYSKKPWLCILSSVYIAPYFSKTGKKSEGFLEALASKIYENKFDCHSNDIAIPPWYLSDFDETFFGFTDFLHRFNDESVIQVLIKYQIRYILKREKENSTLNEDELKIYLKTIEENLNQSARMLTDIETKPDAKQKSKIQKGNSLFKKYWLSFFEDIFFGKRTKLSASLELHGSLIKKFVTFETENIDSILESQTTTEENKDKKTKLYWKNGSSTEYKTEDIDLALIKKIEIAKNKYKKAALDWKERFNVKKPNLSISHFSWQDLKQSDVFYEKALKFFKNWWKRDDIDLKKSVIDYCGKYPVGRYNEQLERNGNKNYPTALTALTSALFVCEEIICFIAKILRDGPGVIVYPTFNLGAKNATDTPFILIKKLIQKDHEFISIMNKSFSISSDTPYLQYTYPHKKKATEICIQKTDLSIAKKKDKTVLVSRTEVYEMIREQEKRHQLEIKQLEKKLDDIYALLRNKEKKSTMETIEKQKANSNLYTLYNAKFAK